MKKSKIPIIINIIGIIIGVALYFLVKSYFQKMSGVEGFNVVMMVFPIGRIVVFTAMLIVGLSLYALVFNIASYRVPEKIYFFSFMKTFIFFMAMIGFYTFGLVQSNEFNYTPLLIITLFGVVVYFKYKKMIIERSQNSIDNIIQL